MSVSTLLAAGVSNDRNMQFLTMPWCRDNTFAKTAAILLAVVATAEKIQAASIG